MEDLPVNFSLLNSRLDDLNTKVKKLGKGRKEVSFMDKSPTESPVQEMVEEITRGISSLPTGVRRDPPPHVRASPIQTKEVQEEEDKPETSEM